ncbi:MAG: hybrid sensor histidine kinase/response regulator [Anaerolineae bacterium]|nr:hybrid sensor histidine kinase/response regulator [Anaerolineae bacterium]
MLSSEPINQPNPQKILYIDDDPVNRSLINRLLTSYKFKVLEAQTGLEGITIARNETPDLILMDINMPGLDGHETTTRMRALPALEKIPIIAVTARTTHGERELALAAGCDGYIPKPIDVDTFPDQVTSYLNGYRETITPSQREHYLGQYSQKLVERLEAKIVELEDANRRLQKTDKLKSDFITLTAHEFRTPITLVYGYARLLQTTVKESGRTDLVEGTIGDLTERICQSVQRLNEAINDILNISLLEADEMHLEYQPVNLAQVVKAALQELNPAKNDRNLNITIEDLDTLPQVMGDAERLQQVFWNLLSNAIKFTPDGGSILVKGWVMDSFSPEVFAATSAKAQHRKPEEGKGIIVLIRDTGIGIDPSEQKAIFEHFYIVGNTDYHTSSKIAFGGGGMGLGLPIACGIIKAHGGRIWVESAGRNVEKNLGSTFYVLLPLRKDN